MGQNCEASLLAHALAYEAGHPRRTQHILKVLALARLLGQEENLRPDEARILQAAAIVHDLPIRFCKARYDGDASQARQQREAPTLVRRFLLEAGYPPSDVEPVLELVLHHHDEEPPKTQLLELLMEADGLVNCYEAPAVSPAQLEKRFQTETGRRLFAAWKTGRGLEKEEPAVYDWKTVDALTVKLLCFNGGDPKRCQHLLKVHRFAQMIGRMEGLDDHTQFVLECAAVVHDIGIRPAEEKYGNCSGKLQEQEGPAYAADVLREVGVAEADIERICYLVGHHHTYDGIDGMDYQILVEADFLVNFYEDGIGADGMAKAVHKIFRTPSGKRLCAAMYGVDPD